MKVEHFAIQGLALISPRILPDSRGLFFEAFKSTDFAQNELPTDFVQDNCSISHLGVVRGLHFQTAPFAQGKLVRCLRGRIFDVALDMRPGSSTFGHHLAVTLDDDSMKALYIPEGFAHGFQALTDNCVVSYKCTALYHATSDAGIRALDQSLGIPWPLPVTEVSAKDQALPLFSELNGVTR